MIHIFGYDIKKEMPPRTFETIQGKSSQWNKVLNSELTIQENSPAVFWEQTLK